MESPREILRRRAQRTAALMGVTIDESMLYRGIDNMLATSGPPRTASDIDRAVYRLVGSAIQRQGHPVDTDALKRAVLAAAQSDHVQARPGEHVESAVSRLRTSGVVVDEDIIARVLVYTEGGTRPISEAQFEQLRDATIQQQIGAVSRDYDYADQLGRSAPPSRPARGGCFGRIFALPGCLMLGVLYLLVLSGLGAGLLLLGGAALMPTGGDIAALQGLFGVNAEQAANTIGGGMIAVGVVLSIAFIARRMVQNVLGIVTLLLFIAAVGAAAAILIRSGLLAEVLQSLFDQFGITLPPSPLP